MNEAIYIIGTRTSARAKWQLGKRRGLACPGVIVRVHGYPKEQYGSGVSN
jgi:hypothetical protein